MSQKQKQNLCKKFVAGAGDELFGVVQQLLNLRTLSCPCVYPTKQPCPRMSEGDECHFGFCALHLNTTKGRELAQLWNKTLEDLEISESEEDEDVTNDEPEETDEEESSEVEDSDEDSDEEPEEESDEDVEEEPTPPQPVKRSRKVAPTASVAQPPTKKAASKKTVHQPVAQKKSEPNIKIIKSKKVRPPASEESSVADGSAKTKYVEQDEEESPAPLPALTFERGNFGNYVNKEYGFVLRPRDRVVLGTENKKGGIIKLTPDQIKICKERNLNYLE